MNPLRPGTKILIACLTALMCSSASAERIGSTYGQTWPIAEPDMVEQIKDLIKRLQSNGEMDAMQRRFQEETLAAFSDPPPVPGISHATENRTWHFDPSVSFSDDVVDEQGRVVAKAGVVYNPFNYIALSKSLVFIDARDDRQVSIAARYLEDNPLNRVVLVGGSWRELQDRWKVKIYYDQHGKLTQHFGIKRVPAILSQDGMKIRVDEVTQ